MVRDGWKKVLEHGKVLLTASAISDLIPVARGLMGMLMGWGAGTSRQLVCPLGEIVVCDLSIIENAEILLWLANLGIQDEQSTDPFKIMPSSGQTLCT